VLILLLFSGQLWNFIGLGN